MAEQSNGGKEEGSFMIKVATFIVDRRNLFFLIFGIAIIFSVISMNWVSVENAMSAYLPDTSETSQGLSRMEEQFITYGTAKIMVTNIPYDEAERISEELEALDTVIMSGHLRRLPISRKCCPITIYLFPQAWVTLPQNRSQVRCRL